MMGSDKTLINQFVSEVFRSKKIAIFCGAGISLNSGIPLADQLERTILSEVLLRQIPKHCPWDRHPLRDDYYKSKNRVEEIIASQIPFEVIMEAALLRNSHNILKIFDSNKPNTNHFAIAALAHGGVANTIQTTNFDTLIEQAMIHENNNLKNREFYVLHKPEQFLTREGNESLHNKICLMKLHGCLTDIKDLKITISEVARRNLIKSIEYSLRKLIEEGEHQVIIFMGYSFSDHFDINIALQNIKSSDKIIIWINHTSQHCDIKDMSKTIIPQFLKGFTGYKVSFDTTEFLKTLVLNYNLPLFEQRDDFNFNWPSYVNRWGDITSINNNWNNYLMMGYIYIRLGNHQDAVSFLKRAAWISSNSGDKDAEAYICSLISSSYQYLENREQQDFFSRSAVSLSKDDFFSLLSQGRVCYEKKDFKGAKRIFQDILNRKEFMDNDFIGITYIGLAIANHGLGRFKESIECSNKSLKIAQKLGDLPNQCSSFMNLGLAYRDLNNYKAAKKADQQAMSIAQKMKNETLIQNIEDNMNRNK